MLIEEFSRGVVVLDRKARARDAGMVEIAHADFGRLRRERMRRDDAKADHTDPPAEHGSSLTFHLDLTDDGGSLAREGCSPAGPYNLQHDRIVLACKPAFCRSMIRKSGYRFSLATNAERVLRGDHAQTINSCAMVNAAGSRPCNCRSSSQALALVCQRRRAPIRQPAARAELRRGGKIGRLQRSGFQPFGVPA